MKDRTEIYHEVSSLDATQQRILLLDLVWKIEDISLIERSLHIVRQHHAVEPTDGKEARIEGIIGSVAGKYGLSAGVLKGKLRNAWIVRARQEAVYNILVETDSSLSECGAALGGRAPATISYSFQKKAEEIEIGRLKWQE